ncbi:MAG TPA: hypothetical protein VF763_14420 [Candidatus Limnocylindrales bacterium]
MADLDPSGFAEFDRLMELVGRTYAVLARAIGEGRVPTDAADYLATETLPHLERARAGLRGWLRSEMAGRAEQRFLVLQGGAVPTEPANSAERRAALLEALLEGRLRREPLDLTPEEALEGLWALAHVRLVFGVLPRLTDADVRFPGAPRTYADIAAPRGPAELAGRIEEIERELWHTAIGRPIRRSDPAFRRTYGFFDAADHLRAEGFRLAG